MRKLLLFCLLLLLTNSCIPAFAQLLVTDKKYPDSLNQLVLKTKSDSIRALSYFQLSNYWSNQNTDTIKAKKYLEKGKLYGQKYPFLKALYSFYLAGQNFYSNVEKSKSNYLKAEEELAHLKTKEAYFFRARSWANYGALLQRQDDDLQVTEILLNKAIPLIKKAGNSEYLGRYYCNVALIFLNKKQYNKAEKYCQLGIDILEKTNLSNTNYLVEGYIFSSKNNLSLNNYKLSKSMLDKAKSLLKKYPDPFYFADYYLAESSYYLKIKDYKQGAKSTNLGLEIAKKTNDLYHIELLFFQQYELYTAEGDYKNALDILNHNIKNQALKFSQNMASYYYERSETYNRLGNTQMAYASLKKFTALNDSINKQQLETKINNLEIKFKSIENNKKINELKIANEKANLSTRNSRLLNWLFGVISLLILSTFIFGIYYYRNQKKLTEQWEEIRLSNAILQGQETERYRVARDLHDGLGNLLVVMKFNLWQFAKEKPATELDEIIRQLDHSVSELRRISHDMMPEMLLNIGLEAALKDLCESLASNHLEIDYHFIGIKSNVPQQTQVAIYRIIQELLTNIVKHAQANNVLLQCTQNKQVFFITLEDDGKGFNTSPLSGKTSGIGLSNIKSRIAYLNGKMEIASSEDQAGTSINIELQLKA